MELDEDKIINCTPERIFHICPKPFWKRYCVNGSNLLVSVPKFGIDTTKNPPWYRIKLKKLVSPILVVYWLFLSIQKSVVKLLPYLVTQKSLCKLITCKYLKVLQIFIYALKFWLKTGRKCAEIFKFTDYFYNNCLR